MYVISFIQGIGENLQGFSNCLIFVVFDEHFYRRFRRCCCLNRRLYDHLPLLDSQHSFQSESIGTDRYQPIVSIEAENTENTENTEKEVSLVFMELSESYGSINNEQELYEKRGNSGDNHQVNASWWKGVTIWKFIIKWCQTLIESLWCLSYYYVICLCWCSMDLENEWTFERAR